ncbi:FMN-binding negative transcriptional regulator [Phenylobacterium sp.]|jgi:transcriptional regulator|uniref:FMN-binding negative transcriptional regulator n=1 Tax=Phenylobacterium sp. TaxID=1871053 RepID=UPI002E31314A|nr:FMN-binding negative transcriptional regulator [Phenylobacterium sp.]HEX3366197.1 FMN-binding negative transcriptional regulator [Phenylobacterium sp.]
MYASPTTREDRQDVLVAAIRTIKFGALVIVSPDGLSATHIPMIVREFPNGVVELEGHVARPNDLWRLAQSGVPALAIFQGPQAYVHPGWYPTKKVDGRAVPSWNYIAVHAHGNLEAVDEDAAWLRSHLCDLTDLNEADRTEPWALTDAPEDYLDAMMSAIVGLRLRVGRLEGNWKMGQKLRLENRLGAIDGLFASASTEDQQVAMVMRDLLPTKP